MGRPIPTFSETPVMTQPTSAVPPPPPPPTPAAATLPTPTSRLVTVQAVNWQNVLDFTHLFRGFRLAINPAKLMMALLAIMLIYAGGRLFDAVWGPQVFANEISSFGTMPSDSFQRRQASALLSRSERLNSLLSDAQLYDHSLTDDRVKQLEENPAAAFRALKAAYRAHFSDEVARFHDRRIAQEKVGDDPTLRFVRDSKTPAETEQDDRRDTAAGLLRDVQAAREVTGRGVFDSLLEYEIDQFDKLIENTLTFVRVSPVRTANGFGDPPEGSAVSGGLLSKDPDRLWRSDTVAGCLANMTITGPRWLFTGAAPLHYRPDNADHWRGWINMLAYRGLYLVSLIALCIFSLSMLAFAGASISRLSALELAGIERAPLKDVFLFAHQRLWVFIKAPLAPFVILLVIGLALALGGMVGAIPFVGEFLLGLFFFIFLAIAFVLMLLLLGIIGGFNLLYPTLAVEGSDAFDAMSRSFAYVYARPWRLLFYTVTSLIYGAITFLFVSFAVYLLLLLTHTFVGWGASFFGYNYGWYSGSLKLDTLWPMPHFMSLISPINWYAMSWSEYLGALFLHFWVFLLITSIGAYVISYYFSSHTIMYLLLRRSVDGQSIREVYLEEPPLSVPAAVPAPASPSPAAAVAPSAPAPDPGA